MGRPQHGGLPSGAGLVLTELAAAADRAGMIRSTMVVYVKK
jgi:hypothetical protein